MRFKIDGNNYTPVMYAIEHLTRNLDDLTRKQYSKALEWDLKNMKIGETKEILSCKVTYLGR